MQDSNPYSSPSAKTAELVDDKYLLQIARFFHDHRERPPSLIRLMLRWPGIPFLAIMAIICILFAISLGILWDSINVLFPLMLLLFFLMGSATRELGSYVRLIRVWPAYKVLIDWRKVDEITGP